MNELEATRSDARQTQAELVVLREEHAALGRRAEHAEETRAAEVLGLEGLVQELRESKAELLAEVLKHRAAPEELAEAHQRLVEVTAIAEHATLDSAAKEGRIRELELEQQSRASVERALKQALGRQSELERELAEARVRQAELEAHCQVVEEVGGRAPQGVALERSEEEEGQGEKTSAAHAKLMSSLYHGLSNFFDDIPESATEGRRSRTQSLEACQLTQTRK
eukprot:TRINITY_DN12097_c0_g1_i3.p1 TRINITY_DN12097_c0_g1~~TRINITY_DN12097_c0_g1_i3.p1  ORF type:complete len:224 (+),score=68.93 TRINITY_DN12097_c0_g1_i3:78-749(+)